MYDDIVEVISTTIQSRANEHLAKGWRLIAVDAGAGVAKDHDGTSDMINTVIYVLGRPGE